MGKKKPDRQFQVVVDLNGATYVAQCMLRGILRFAREAGDWSVLAANPGMIETPSPKFAFGGLVGGRGDSLLRFAKVLRGRNAVEIDLDVVSVARLAAEHFLERGFVRYAFVGHDSSPTWSEDRLAAFRRELAPHGLSCEAYPGIPAGKKGDLAFRLRALASWLAARPRPLAVFAAFDNRAREVLDACRAALDSAMRGRPGSPRRIVFGGVRVDTRASTARRSSCGRRRFRATKSPPRAASATRATWRTSSGASSALRRPLSAPGGLLFPPRPLPGESPAPAVQTVLALRSQPFFLLDPIGHFEWTIPHQPTP